MRDLRNHGGDVIGRVQAGERVTITRDGEPVAELRPLPRRRLGARALIEQFVPCRRSTPAGSVPTSTRSSISRCDP